MTTFVKNYVKGCAICQKNKINTHPTTPPLTPIKGTNRLFAQITADFITALPPVRKGEKTLEGVLVVVDQGLMKGVIFIPISKKINAKETAKLLIDNLYKRYGLHDTMITDRGPQFNSKLAREMAKVLGVKLKFSTAYHPQTDRQA